MSLPGADSRERLQQALAAVQRARGEPPAKGKASFGQAFQLVVTMRNELLRQPSSAHAPPLQGLNPLLSLMSSVEFPLGGYHSERMDLIERELKELAAAATDAPAPA
jgi:hypothetical protein